MIKNGSPNQIVWLISFQLSNLFLSHEFDWECQNSSDDISTNFCCYGFVFKTFTRTYLRQLHNYPSITNKTFNVFIMFSENDNYWSINVIEWSTKSRKHFRPTTITTFASTSEWIRDHTNKQTVITMMLNLFMWLDHLTLKTCLNLILVSSLKNAPRWLIQ